MNNEDTPTFTEQVQDWAWYAERHPDHPHTDQWARELLHSFLAPSVSEVAL